MSLYFNLIHLAQQAKSYVWPEAVQYHDDCPKTLNQIFINNVSSYAEDKIDREQCISLCCSSTKTHLTEEDYKLTDEGKAHIKKYLVYFCKRVESIPGLETYYIDTLKDEYRNALIKEVEEEWIKCKSRELYSTLKISDENDKIYHIQRWSKEFKDGICYCCLERKQTIDEAYVSEVQDKAKCYLISYLDQFKTKKAREMELIGLNANVNHLRDQLSQELETALENDFDRGKIEYNLDIYIKDALLGTKKLKTN
jgi:hypothetical protein